MAYSHWLNSGFAKEVMLCPCPSIAQTLYCVADEQADLAVVPVENSIGGSVAITLDTLWQLDQLQIQRALILPITHALLSNSVTLDNIKTVYSHPQALAQCQKWLEKYIGAAQLVPTNSTTEALEFLHQDQLAGAIASPRASQLYNVPILVPEINDYPDNCTRFWVLGKEPSTNGDCTSLAFSLPANVPGSLVKPLQVFAKRLINLSRIESRPTKRSLGEYLFFIDLEKGSSLHSVEEALEELATHTEVLKVFGHYNLLPLNFAATN
ncbi:MAG: prephenate dehydratase, partial [Okeania sp. SIO2D1]|nr:prephenate dehydratase [Okeania sp. SIO2D1]